MTDAYKDTVFLPTTDFPMRGDLPKREPGFLQYWQDIRLYETLRADRAGQTRYVLHDGPPYANGNIHIGHAVNKILKDVVARSQWLLGKDTAYVPGWDCHGLPIEWKIEEQYRKAGKDKDQVPVLQFRAECRNFAEHWVSVQAGEFQRLGVMGDWADPYTTMTRAAEARIVGEIHKFLLNGRLYKGMKPVMWSIVEKTALAEAEIEYHDHTSPTIYVGFPITVAKNAAALIGAEAIIWTTTPWTLPGNRAIAYGEDLDYGVYAAPDGRRLLLAAALRESVMAALGISELTELAALKGAQLKGAEARHPLHAVGGIFADAIPLLAGDFVTTEAGTGLVHIAPGHGEDDFNLYRAHTGSVRDEWYFNVLTDDGAYQPHIPFFAGKRVQRPDGKSGDANKAVIEALAAAGHLWGQGKINHSYPHSWRSKAPVIFRTTPQWFIALDEAPAGQDALRALALKAIGETRWIPAVGENRIRGMIETRPDWCISRQRAWGVPIAIFVDKKTGKPLADPAVCARVVEAFRKDGADAWYARPPQEFLGDAYRAEDYQAVFDIVDVWFESGSTHAFVLEDRKDQHWPADLYLEGSDQHRGWFHSSLLESCGTRGHAPYRAVLTHGFVLDEQGRKMSKSLGNVVAPQDVIQQYGADILRLFVLATDYGDDIRVGPETLKHQTELYRRLRNTLRYLLGALNGYSDAETVAFADLPELERFMLHRLHAVDVGIRKAIDDCAFNRMLTELHHFCAVDVSAFYFDVRKDSLYCDPASSLRRRAVRTVMHLLFEHLVRWLAPILCFTAEEAFLTRHGGMDKAAKRSVHRETFLPVPAAWQDAALAEKWERLRDLRLAVTGAIELARNDKKIGASLQAHPEIFVDAGTASLLAAVPFADICITSDVTVTVAEPASLPPVDAFRLADLPEVGVVVHVAKGEKCARCWRVLPEVGEDKTHAALCRRCVSAVAPSKAA